MSVARCGRRAGTLPADITSFVGRRRELAAGKTLLTSGRLVTLTGVGGVGKTRLAMRLASEVQRSFPDGAFVVELADLHDEELLIGHVTTALGLGEARSPPLDQLCDYVAGKTLLIVLDNCEHLIGRCAMLSTELLKAGPRLRILATSRQALTVDGEHLLTVPPLSVPDTPDSREQRMLTACSQSEAVQLFTERAAAIQPGFTVTEGNAPAVTGICRRLDGIPLAIELAVVQLRALSAQMLFDHLNRRFQLLTRGCRTALPRHQTLRAAIEWSYDLCTPGEKLLWERMAVFPGSCELEAIEHICSGDGIAADDVLDLVVSLVDKSIICTENSDQPPRYRLLETINEFGAELLAASGQHKQIRAKHFNYYQRLAGQAERQWFSPSRPPG